MSHPVFEIVTTTAGAISIRNKVVNEIMHNPVGPWAEANALYIDQAGLSARLREDTAKPLVIFDIGLGAAANSLATLHAVRAAGGKRPVKLVSFERDLELLRFALDHSSRFAHFHGFELALEMLLADGFWSGDGVEWTLHHGDFSATIENTTERAHIVYFDPYSPAVNGDMWTVEVFKKLRAKCSNDGCLVMTYSRATPVRAALLHAGFFVGAGPSTGLKAETTQAGTRSKDLLSPLGLEWLDRWKRSHVPHPFGAREDQIEDIRRSIFAHPQFA